ncbi:heme-binding domain-containing protein [Chitinophaga tropicalis]|uniref:Cytochrome C n=1 Tax=Chitinophaga tropicalis TaxID=2683588 RepID=A0A7K1U0M4_9BACT|nr:heme-binding domain-containing protein [Chitinophaga tropicalis]MVT07921.1 cytochrome C [Chitinophaga tropicalis]
MRRSRIILLSLLAIVVLMQFIRPSRNENNREEPANDITKVYPMPADVQKLLKVACYDCHSNNTQYPWYTNIQPVGWWMAHHVDEGKEELNFNEYASYSPKRQQNKLKRIREEVEEDEMPLGSYTIIHRDARLTAQQKDLLIKWIDSTLNR